MNYKFYCCDCKHEYQVDIPMKEYHEQKEKQKCPECGGHARRVYEWNGIATGSGEGWCGKKGGTAI